jgi:8-oxo-dGTP pyrophosphatase MutT (NUDIX family)
MGPGLAAKLGPQPAYTRRMSSAGSLPPARELAIGLSSWLGARSPTSISEGRRAAVLLVLYDKAGRPHTLLTKRSDAVPVHSGQISLPGGRMEPDDADLWATALRETEEEVGVPRGHVAPVGRLDDVATIATSFVITPYVGLLEDAPATKAQASEVARIIEAPLDELLAEDARLPERPTITTLRYPLFGEDIWGATARILTAFLSELREAGLAPRR